MENPNIKNTRNYGIDLLRIFCMYMVFTAHFIRDGGIMGNSAPFSGTFYTVWVIQALFYCCVNVFAMISGYVMVELNVNAFKIIPLWLKVFFYSVGITVLFAFVPPFNSMTVVSKKDYITALAPVLSSKYWYFTKYFGMFFFIPFINKLLNSLNKKEHGMLCIIILLLFSALPSVGFLKYDPFRVSGGFSVTWLISMYIIGAWFRKYPVVISKTKSFLFYILSSALSFIFAMVVLRVTNNAGGKYLINYTPIYIVASGVSLLLLFSQITVNNDKLRKIILFISELSFSVYLIHTHPVLRSTVFLSRFSSLAENNPFVLAIKILIYVLGLFIFCLAIDVIRYFIFKLMKINKIPGFLSKKFCKL